MPSQTPLRILSLDAGGIRSISSLVILRDIIDQLSHSLNRSDAPPLACNIFDLICGTGTGGLIAIMLGRLRMSMDDTIKEYLDLATAVYGEKPPLRHWVSQLVGRGANDHEILVSKVKDLIHKHNPGDGAATVITLADPRGEEACKVFVVAVNQAYVDAPPRLFRTFRDESSADSCEIWEAVRATMAVSKKFGPITFGSPPETFCVSVIVLCDGLFFIMISIATLSPRMRHQERTITPRTSYWMKFSAFGHNGLLAAIFPLVPESKTSCLTMVTQSMLRGSFPTAKTLPVMYIITIAAHMAPMAHISAFRLTVVSAALALASWMILLE